MDQQQKFEMWISYLERSMNSTKFLLTVCVAPVVVFAAIAEFLVSYEGVSLKIAMSLSIASLLGGAVASLWAMVIYGSELENSVESQLGERPHADFSEKIKNLDEQMTRPIAIYSVCVVAGYAFLSISLLIFLWS